MREAGADWFRYLTWDKNREVARVSCLCKLPHLPRHSHSDFR
jgi:hypothetical protein